MIDIDTLLFLERLSSYIPRCKKGIRPLSDFSQDKDKNKFWKYIWYDDSAPIGQ